MRAKGAPLHFSIYTHNITTLLGILVHTGYFQKLQPLRQSVCYLTHSLHGSVGPGFKSIFFSFSENFLYLSQLPGLRYWNLHEDTAWPGDKASLFGSAATPACQHLHAEMSLTRSIAQAGCLPTAPHFHLCCHPVLWSALSLRWR